MNLSVPEKRKIVASKYNSEKWRRRVAGMPDYQIIAIYQKMIEKERNAYKNVFGRFAPLAPFSFLFLIGFGILLLKLVKGSLLGFYVIIFGVFSPMLVDAIITSEIHRMDNEE